jgi:hypothetical protein
MAKSNEKATLSVVLGDEQEGERSGSLWQRSVVVRRDSGNGEVIRYEAILYGMAAPVNEVHLWQGGDAAPLLGVLPLDFWEWTTDAELMEWVASCYQQSSTRYERTIRKMRTMARKAYTYQNEEPAPF